MQETEDYCFYEDSLPEWDIPAIIVAEDSAGELYFQFRPICEALHLQRSHQNAFIQADSRVRRGTRTIEAPTRGGKQDTLFLRRREVAIWLTIIDPEKVNGIAKGRLEEFQEALWNLADRTVFRKRRSIDAGAEDVGTVVVLSGAQRGEFDCDCGRKHMIELVNGEMRVFHR